ncbi:iron-containing alcohol dehydrogenase [Chloroflexota bacterium]
MSPSEIMRYTALTEVIFGWNSLGVLGAQVKKLGGTKVLFVTDPGVKGAGILEEAFKSLEDANIPIVLYDQATPDPDTQTIDQVVRMIKENECDFVVTAGGGSGMCTGKGAALMATNPGNIRDYAGEDRYSHRTLPCIAIPTTAGSGSEVSRVTVITDEITKFKLAIRGFDNAPNVAILDPVVLRTTPRAQAVASGVDALTHAIEAYCARRASPVTDGMALPAMETIAKDICPSILAGDPDASARMLLASSMANFACGNAGLGLSHALNSTITATYKRQGYPPVAYGDIHAILLPLVMEFNQPVQEERLAVIARALGVAKKKHKSEAVLARAGIERLKELLSALNAPSKLPWDNVPDEVLVEMTKPLVDAAPVSPNPRRYTQQDLVGLLRKALQGWD